MPTTTNGAPYPTLSGNAPNVPADIQALAEWTDTAIYGSSQFNPPRAHVYRSGAMPVPHNTWTFVQYGTERIDTHNMHSTTVNASRVTATVAGNYELKAVARFAQNATGYRGIQLRRNAGGNASAGDLIQRIEWPVAPGGTFFVAVSDEVYLSVGDYVETFVYQNSGASLSLDSGDQLNGLKVRWVAPT